MGVECIIVDGCDHMWNQVKIDGKWYIVDSTWGDAGDTANDWFLLIGSDSVHDENHTVENYDFCYYDENGNEIPVTEYACMPAPEVEKTDYVYPVASATPQNSTTTATPQNSTTTNIETKSLSESANSTKPLSATPSNDKVNESKPAVHKPAKVKTIRKTVKKGKKIKIKVGKWKVKNKKIVSISKKKVVKGLKKGKTTITGTIKGISYRYIVTVK